MLDGTLLFTDCGAYLYSANYRERNNFRSTAYHNTPCIDGEEINRFVRPEYLWVLRNDANHEAGEFVTNEGTSSFSGSHDGYGRLPDPVIVKREFTLDHRSSVLTIDHGFEGKGDHLFVVPFHVASGIGVATIGKRKIALRTEERTFHFEWMGDGWDAEIEICRVSPSYGALNEGRRVNLRRHGKPENLTVRLA
jgi:hypothetical protein